MEDIAITPLAISMLAGPGAMAAVILLSSQATSPIHHIVIIGLSGNFPPPTGGHTSFYLL